jgi:hypothetical protein
MSSGAKASRCLIMIVVVSGLWCTRSRAKAVPGGAPVRAMPRDSDPGTVIDNRAIEAELKAKLDFAQIIRYAENTQTE